MWTTTTLAALYQRASVFAFLSEYEGFGLTPLEALAAGVPPVVLDTPVARETCGAAARYVAPERANDADRRRDRRAADRRRRARARSCSTPTDVLARYDWERAAADTLAVLEEAAVGR